MTATTHFRLLTVDLDDTLWPCYSTIRRAEDAHYGWLSSRAPRLTDAYDQERLRRHRKGVARDNPRIAYDLTAVRRTSLQELLMGFGFGMTALWVNREGGSWPEELDPPVAEVADMMGLKSWLEGAGRGI